MCAPTGFYTGSVDDGTNSRMSLPAILGDPRKIALFLDFDGTLVELAERPDAVILAETTRSTLRHLADATHGALAIVTGRDIEDIDRLVTPLRLPVAGVHGLTRRDAAGVVRRPASAAAVPDDAAALLAPLLARSPRLLLERKTAALALHYRLAPEFAHECVVAMERVAALAPGLGVTHNKMVVEARPVGADKGRAVLDFMREPPFRDRRPVFAGDDVTDEDAFAAVNALGGDSIKIGEGPTSARWRASGTAEFLAWLHEGAEAARRDAGVRGASSGPMNRDGQAEE